MRKKRIWRAGRQLLPLLLLGAGICLLLYPWVANWLYERGVDSVVETYAAEAERMDTADAAQMWEEARQYNAQLNTVAMALTDPFLSGGEGEISMTYESILSMDDTGYLCAVEIPKIKVYLPVYHGTSETVLKKGAGHLEGSSFPVGGESTHVVLSAHTGLNTAKMFTDLPELVEGDLFFLHVLDQTLAYEVCSVQTVLPEEVEFLSIQKDRDLVTLLTCTPYGMNTHRLLVTGERVDSVSEGAEAIVKKPEEEPGSSRWMRSYRSAAITGLFLTGEICMAAYARKHQKRRRKRRRRRTQRNNVQTRNARMREPQAENVRMRRVRRRGAG